jgi:hypothetical protein
MFFFQVDVVLGEPFEGQLFHQIDLLGVGDVFLFEFHHGHRERGGEEH